MKNNNATTSGPPTTNLSATTNLQGVTSISTPEHVDNSRATIDNSGASIDAETMQVLILLVKNPKWKNNIFDLWEQKATTYNLEQGLHDLTPEHRSDPWQLQSNHW